jgi:hypothetical protein
VHLLPPQKTALFVASGRDIDGLLTNVLASEGWSIKRVGGYYGCIRELRVMALGGPNDAFGNNAA